MTTTRLDDALNEVDEVYNTLVDIANDIIAPYVKDVNSLINEAETYINNLTIDYLRDLMLKLSLKAFQLCEIKEKATIKAVCAESIRKEKYAVKFGGLSGSVASKENEALTSISYEILAETTYDLVGNLLKTKLDEVHRVVDSIKTIIMSRMQEAKLTNVGE